MIKYCIKIGAVCSVVAALSGCSLLGDNNSNVWNTDAGGLNNQINCASSLGTAVNATSDQSGSYSWLNANLTDESQWINVFFKENYGGTSNDINNDINTDTFRYFPLTSSDNPVDIAPYRVDNGIYTFVEERYGSNSIFSLFDANDARDHVDDMTFYPLVNTDHEKMTQIVSSIGELARNSDYEIYTMNYSSITNKRLSNFDPYETISKGNFPAVIFVLYNPVKYATLSQAEREKLTVTDPTSGVTYKLADGAGHMYFKAYYSVYHFNNFFDSQCQIQENKVCVGSNCDVLSPPWEFSTCVSSNTTTSMLDAGSVKTCSPNKTAINVIADKLKTIFGTGTAYAASNNTDTGSSDTKTGLWTRFKSGANNVWRKILNFFKISADATDPLTANSGAWEQLMNDWRSQTDSVYTAPSQYSNAVSELGDDLYQRIRNYTERDALGLANSGDPTDLVGKFQKREITDGMQLLSDIKQNQGWGQDSTVSSMWPVLHRQEWENVNSAYKSEGCKASCDTGKGQETETYDPFKPDGNTRATDLEEAPNQNNGVCGAPSTKCMQGELRCTVANVSGKDSDVRACGNEKWQSLGHTCLADRTRLGCIQEERIEPGDDMANFWFTLGAGRAFSNFTNAYITQMASSSLAKQYSLDATSTGNQSLASLIGTLVAAAPSAGEGSSTSAFATPLNSHISTGKIFLYSLPALQKNLNPQEPHGCANDSSLVGNQEAIMKCAFAHSIYQATIGPEDIQQIMTDRTALQPGADPAASSSAGTEMGDGLPGLADATKPLAPNNILSQASQQLQQGLQALSQLNITKQIAQGISQGLQSLFTGDSENNTGSQNGTPLSQTAQGLAGPQASPAITTQTPYCWFTPGSTISLQI